MKIAQQLFEESLRPAVIFQLSTMLIDCEAVSDELKDAFEEDAEYIYEALDIDEDYDDIDFYELRDVLEKENKLDFLVKFETPIPTQFFDGGGMVYSWGYYTSHWSYGKTYNECCKKALKWRKQWIKQQEKRA